MINYKIVKAPDFLPEHLAYIEKFKSVIELISSKSNEIMGLKDVRSNHLVGSDFYAKIVGLQNAQDVIADTTAPDNRV